jgi:hypothetical protein
MMTLYKLICVGIDGSHIQIAKGDDKIHQAIRKVLSYPSIVSVTVFADGKPHSVHSDWSNWEAAQ